MTPAPLPAAEEPRLHTLRGLAVLDTASDLTLDGLVRTAAHVASAPIALISLIDAERQWFKSRLGINISQTPRDIAFCAHTILGKQPFIVPDAKQDVRFIDNPLVTGAPHIRLYIGVPLIVDDQAIGALCVIDHTPRTPDAETIARLVDIGHAIEHWLVSHREHQLLRQREFEYRQLVEHLPAIVYRAAIEPPHPLSFVSQRIERFGCTRDEWITDYHTPSGRMHPQDRERVAIERAVSLAFGDSVQVDYRILDGEGQWRHYHDAAHVLRPDNGAAPYLQGVMLDVSERVTAETEAREAEAYWRGLFNQLPDGVLVVNSNQQIVDANPQATAMLGYSLEELLELDLQNLQGEVLPDALSDEARCVFTGDQFIAERIYQHRDGHKVHVEVRAGAPINDRYIKVLRDITQRRAQEAQLRKLSAAVEQSSESIFIADLEGTIEYVNEAGASISGYTREELIGQNSRILHSGKTPKPTHNALWATLSQGHAWKGHLYNRRKNGVEYIERATITPIQTVEGKTSHYLAVKEDVTEKERMREELDRHRHHLEELVALRTAELEQAKHVAESASNAKSAFLAAMSHEIRTPMNGVVGIVDVLRQSSLTPYQSDLADTIRESSFALLHIIDDILDFSKIEAGRLSLESESIDLRKVVEQACIALQQVAHNRNVELQVFVDPGLPQSIISDGIRIRQILNNLIGNAIKFSAGLERPGKVRVCAAPDGKGQLRLEVIDNGIGIPPEARQKIFDPFVQGESSTTRRYGGTGLGLTICRRLVDMLRGSIEVISSPGSGTTFTITLPVEVDQAAATAPQQELSGIECHISLRDPQLAADWCAYLAAAAARASISADPLKSGWSIAGSGKNARVVITDSFDNLNSITLPNDTTVCEFAVVAIEEGQRRHPRLRKPGLVSLDCPVLQQESLLLAVAMSVGRKPPVIEQLERSEPFVFGSPPTIEEAAEQGRLVLIAEDNDINQKVIQRQLALLGLASETVNNGADALKRWRNGRYAMLLTDLHMPAMDGYELAKAIRREQNRDRPLPIIAISATTLRGEAERCRDAGMNDFLSKPVQLEHLADTLSRWLPSATVTSTTDSPVAAASLDAVPFFDETVLPKLVGDDPELLAEFRNDYLRSAHRGIAELRTALTIHNWETSADVAHRLKSSSRSVGMLKTGECCERIEAAARSKDREPITTLVPVLESLISQAMRILNPEPPAFEELPAEPQKSLPWVVIVDDEPFQSKLLKRQLELLGIERIHICDSGAAALTWLQGGDSSRVLVLLDLNMPDMDGVELMRHLAERQFAGTLALVSGANERVLETADRLAQTYQLRVNSYLHKPVSPEALDLTITRWRNGSNGHGILTRTRKLRSAAEVRHAIEADQLVVYYQPVVSVEDGTPIGVEALVRWLHPTDGLLGADTFIEVAEAHGMIDALTNSVLQKALAQVTAWRANGLRLRVAVNVSMQNLAHHSFPEYVLSELSRHGLTPGDLILEVTESQLLRDARVPMNILTRLRLKKIGLSIDDFGTGHSSLSQLRDLPFDELKIDRGFVHGSHERATQRAIFHASLNMAHQLKMTAVAEGVEDSDDWDFISKSGCDVAQGYFVGRPMPAEDLPNWQIKWLHKFGELNCQAIKTA